MTISLSGFIRHMLRPYPVPILVMVSDHFAFQLSIRPLTQNRKNGHL